MTHSLAALKGVEFDVLVVGGGIYGATICQAVARQGLQVALVEQADFGSQSSANSLKTIHGGLRYLQDANLSLVRRMVRERRGWMQMAPHLIRPLPFLLPTNRSLKRHKGLFKVALPLIDMLGNDRNQGLTSEQSLPASAVWSKEAALPYFASSDVTGAAYWHDAQIYSADRLLWFVLQEAVASGAVVANYVQVHSLLWNDDKVVGVNSTDLIANEALDISAKIVVNASGADIDSLTKGQNFTPSMAFNLVVRQFEAKIALGILFNLEIDRKSLTGTLFAIPWQGRTLIGTVHLPVTKENSEEWPSRQIVEDVLAQVNEFCCGADLTFDDVDFIYRGYLPIEGEPAGLDLVRESKLIDHENEDRAPGLVSVVGVKYTTARWTALKCLELICHKLGVESRPNAPDGHAKPAISTSELAVKVAREVGHLLQPAQIDHMVRCYGSAVVELISLIAQEPALAEPVGSIMPTCRAQLLYAWQYEMGRTVDSIGNRLGLDLGGSLSNMSHCSAAERERRELLKDDIDNFLVSRQGSDKENKVGLKSNKN